MRALLKIVVFLVLFVVFLAWRFPYDSLVERAVRQAEAATGSTIIYQPVSAGPLGVKVKNLNVTLASGASLQFDTARLFPTRKGLKATAYQGDSEMKVNFNGTLLNLELDDITVKSGNDMIGTARATGTLNYGVVSREGDGSLRLVVPELGIPLPLPDKSVEFGSSFTIRNVGTADLPRSGVAAELNLISGDGSATANGTVTLEGQPPPASPLLNGNLRYESPLARGNLRLSGTWDNPATTVTRK